MVLPPHSDGEIIYVPPHKRPRPSTLAVWKARIAKDPLVYIFLGATVGVLSRGIYAMLRNDHGRSQKMMRYRVAFQLCTVGAVLGGVYWRAFQEGGMPLTVSGSRGRDAEEAAARDRSYMADPRMVDVAAATAAARLGVAATVSPVRGPLPKEEAPLTAFLELAPEGEGSGAEGSGAVKLQ